MSVNEPFVGWLLWDSNTQTELSVHTENFVGNVFKVNQAVVRYLLSYSCDSLARGKLSSKCLVSLLPGR